MSVIQNIRDKYARWAVVAIALSLLGFILMDAFAGRTRLFGGNSTTLGVINGEEINIHDFDRKVKASEEMAQQQGYSTGEESRQRSIENVWNTEVQKVLMDSEFEKLGIRVGKKEIDDYIYGANPPADLKQNFTDPNTGVYNPQLVQQYFINLKKNGQPEAKDQTDQYLASLELQRKAEKYTSLVTNTTYFPKWFVEKQNTDNSLMASVSYVNVPYSTISDSAVKVSDGEIQEYISKHKDEFNQEDETRSISYVLFNAAPSADDSAVVYKSVKNLKPEFDSTKDAAAFLTRNGSSLPYYDGYVSKSQMQVVAKDTIFTMTPGQVYGPYQDAGNYVLAKLISIKPLPDSVKCRHILLGTVDPQTRRPIMTDSVAKQKADSIAAAIRGGANFDSLEARYSTDKASHQEKGVMTFSSTQIQSEGFAKEFGQFILFDGKPGDKKVVKTQYGEHYIEILEHKNVVSHYQVAYFAKPIIASTETDNAASNAASMFSGDSRSLKAFNDNFEKNLKAKGLNKLVATDIRGNDYNIAGIGNSRSLVKTIFNADAGDVLEPVRVDDNYIVAAVTNVDKAGLPSVSKVRSMVEPILLNKKKAQQIKTKLGKISTLEAAAQVSGQPVQTVDSLYFSGRNQKLGFEQKVLGASFDPAAKGKVIQEALEGQAGVYVLKVNNVVALAAPTANIEEQRQMLEMQTRQAMGRQSPLQALRKVATIKDNRSKFY